MEITLYDMSGKPHAYIAFENYDEKIIYLWNGKACAYLDGKLVYSFNGSHIGWFMNGILYNKEGFQIGFTEHTCPSTLEPEPIKSAKKALPPISVKEAPHPKPIFKSEYSPITLSVFLEVGC